MSPLPGPNNNSRTSRIQTTPDLHGRHKKAANPPSAFPVALLAGSPPPEGNGGQQRARSSSRSRRDGNSTSSSAGHSQRVRTRSLNSSTSSTPRIPQSPRTDHDELEGLQEQLSIVELCVAQTLSSSDYAADDGEMMDSVARLVRLEQLEIYYDRVTLLLCNARDELEKLEKRKKHQRATMQSVIDAQAAEIDHYKNQVPKWEEMHTVAERLLETARELFARNERLVRRMRSKEHHSRTGQRQLETRLSRTERGLQLALGSIVGNEELQTRIALLESETALMEERHLSTIHELQRQLTEARSGRGRLRTARQDDDDPPPAYQSHYSPSNVPF